MAGQARRNIFHSHHDCANDGTCGRSIQKFEINGGNIFFYDNNRQLVVQVPKLPKYSKSEYKHDMYREAESKQLKVSPSIDDVLPQSFRIKYGFLNCVVNYDNLSQQEQKQIGTDIKSAYDAFKNLFCLDSRSANKDIEIYIFNNRSDYVRYNDLLGIDRDGGIDKDSGKKYTTIGVTDYKKVLTYKQTGMDSVLGHELGHILQMCFGSEKVKDLSKTDTELIANVVGREVEEINQRSILRQNDKDDENKAGQIKSSETEAKQTSKDINTDTFSLFDVIFSTIKEIFSPILSFFSWLFNFNNEEDNRQPRNLSLLSDVDSDFLEDYTNNNLSDHYHSYDELIM